MYCVKTEFRPSPPVIHSENLFEKFTVTETTVLQGREEGRLCVNTASLSPQSSGDTGTPTLVVNVRRLVFLSSSDCEPTIKLKRCGRDLVDGDVRRHTFFYYYYVNQSCEV